jgi:hypothetical protein
VACSGSPATTVKIPAAMRAKGYSNTEAVDWALHLQVHWQVKKFNRRGFCHSVSCSLHSSCNGCAVLDGHNKGACVYPVGRCKQHYAAWPSSLAAKDDAQNKPPAPNWPPELAGEQGGLRSGSGTRLVLVLAGPFFYVLWHLKTLLVFINYLP